MCSFDECKHIETKTHTDTSHHLYYVFSWLKHILTQTKHSIVCLIALYICVPCNLFVLVNHCVFYFVLLFRYLPPAIHFHILIICMRRLYTVCSHKKQTETTEIQLVLFETSRRTHLYVLYSILNRQKTKSVSYFIYVNRFTNGALLFTPLL